MLNLASFWIMVKEILFRGSPIKRKHISLFNIFLLYFSALACAARADDEVVSLYDHIRGPAVETYSLTMSDSGKVKEEKYNIGSKSDNWVKSMSVSEEQRALVLERARKIRDQLSKIRYEPCVLAIDGEFRQIRLAVDGKVTVFTFYAYNRAKKSEYTEIFMTAWESLKSDMLAVKE